MLKPCHVFLLFNEWCDTLRWTLGTSLTSMEPLENESFKLKPWPTHALVASPRPFHYNSFCKLNYCDKLNLVLANLVKPLLLSLLLCMFSSLVCLIARMLVYFVIVFSMYRLYGEQRSFVKRVWFLHQLQKASDTPSTTYYFLYALELLSSLHDRKYLCISVMLC